ncbi:MAG: dihydroorotase [Aeromonas sp.]
MNTLLIKNATLVNEGRIYASDVLIEGERIARIAPHIALHTVASNAQVIDASGRHLIPGMIDDQVHFREPGLTHKGTIASESRAAVAGGTTSFMEMPNVNPPTTTLDALEAKYQIAAHASAANYSFYLGATNDNLAQIKGLDPKQSCGVKVFMGSSTGNMLVDNQDTLAAIFRESPVMIVTHCEDTPTIIKAEAAARAKWGEAVPMGEHGRIRSDEACYTSSSMAVALAKQYGAKLHVLHLTSAKELSLFTTSQDVRELKDKQITAEVCVHHLFFNDTDYDALGSQIKCNPAVKSAADQHALLDAVRNDVLDIIATDHAPHTWEEKQHSYFKAPSGVPLVQHSLQALLELYHNGVFTLETIVKKTSHAVAERFQVQDRGYIREGYYADLVLLDLGKPYVVNNDNILYHCGWSPFNGYRFQSTIELTLVNGHIAWQHGQVSEGMFGQRLTFNR